MRVRNNRKDGELRGAGLPRNAERRGFPTLDQVDNIDIVQNSKGRDVVAAV